MTKPSRLSAATDAQELPLPHTPMDCALLVRSLRTLVRSWRDRAAVCTPDRAAVYAEVERDLSAAIESHAESRALWVAARDDLARHIVDALRADQERDA